MAQRALNRRRLEAVDLGASIFIVGYWRSGTTLAHELMSLDPRYATPTTYDCFNPHHYLMTRSTVTTQTTVRRPMDDMRVGAASPQEDEFGLLSLGARSPYEAFICPTKLAEALCLADPQDLNAKDRARWERLFLEFLRGVSLAGAGRPLIVKSPTHGYRISTIRKLVPRAKFVVVTRNPYEVFESVVGLWRTMAELYGWTPPLPHDDVRSIVLRDRLRYEERLEEGLVGLGADRCARLSYEDLARAPVAAIQSVYDGLRLDGFETVLAPLTAEAEARRRYRPRAILPDDFWMNEIRTRMDARLRAVRLRPDETAECAGLAVRQLCRGHDVRAGPANGLFPC